MNSKVQKLNVYEFGRQLIQSNDLDPVYVLLWNSDLLREELLYWLLSYFCFYHVGTASWCADALESGDTTYWTRMRLAAESKEYPRAHERRHFRGQLSVKSVDWLRRMGTLSLVGPLLEGEWEVAAVIKHVKTWYGFGDWIAFKVADMLERLNLSRVRFNTGAMFLFDSPDEGARRMWDDYAVQPQVQIDPKTDYRVWAVESILRRLGDLAAPPRYERKINVQEAETVMCKFNSYCKGHYEIGEDIRACRVGLLHFARCNMSQRLIEAGRKGGLW